MDSVACSADLSWPSSANGGGGGVAAAAAAAGDNSPGLVPLRLAHLCRGLTLPDVNGCCLELHSPDGRRSCLLRAPDPQEARTWFDALHARMQILNRNYLNELNSLLPPNQVGGGAHFGCPDRIGDQAESQGGRVD